MKLMTVTLPGVRAVLPNFDITRSSRAVAAEVMRKADTDADGKISFNEFVHWYCEQPESAVMHGDVTRRASTRRAGAHRARRR